MANQELLTIINEIIKEERETFLKKEEIPIEEIVVKNFYEYGKTVILDRAIPNVADGLKPVQRRILFAMYKIMKNNNSFKKSARIVGDVIGKYHPHGDSSVYEAIVSMIQPWVKRIPLIEGQGNFGSIDGDNAAAMRYTEIKLNELKELFFDNLSEDTVEFTENYDGSEKEPTVLPVMFPQLLINGILKGSIAVGIASQMPPHNPKEILTTLNKIYQNRKKNQKINVSTFKKLITGPDFPTKGISNIKMTEWENILKTGKGTIEIESTFHIEKIKNRNIIVVDSIPYSKNKSTIINNLISILDNKTIPDITNIKDESNNDDIRILIFLKTKIKDNKEIKKIWEQLLKSTQLKTTYTYNINIVVDNKIKEWGIIEIINHYADFKENIIRKKIIKEINLLQKQKEYLELILKILDDIDNIIKIIKESNNKQSIINKLKRKKYTEQEIQIIISLPLIKISKFEKSSIKKDIKEIERKIKDKQKLLEDKIKFYNFLIEHNSKTLQHLKKHFNTNRLTKINYT